MTSVDDTIQGTIPYHEEPKPTSPSVDSQAYYSQEAVAAYPANAQVTDQSSFTRDNNVQPSGYQYEKDGGTYYSNNLTTAGVARSIILSVLSLLFVLFLIVWGFILIVPTQQLIDQWYVIQLDFTRIAFSELFQQFGNDDVDSLTFSDSGIASLIRFGLFGYTTGFYDGFDDFVAVSHVKKPLFKVNITDIIFNQIQQFGSTSTKVLAAQYPLSFPTALSHIDDWQSEAAAVTYIILLILSFAALGVLIWIIVVQTTKSRAYKNGFFNFKAPLYVIILISFISTLLYVIGAGAITKYASSDIVGGLKNERAFGIFGTRSVLFFLFSWIGFSVSFIVLLAAGVSLWLTLQD